MVSECNEDNRGLDIENSEKWDMVFNALFDKEQRYMTREYICGFCDTSPWEEEELVLAWYTSAKDYKEEYEKMLRKDEATRRKFMKELEEEDFEPFSNSSYDSRPNATMI
ncbi:hypothetical protein FNV43_RR03531 [Rhamnella rubrinervis]|uniref:Uncharacterized protein n=1 Tax=Rhamnella rubrinervis TaxID=2594499 RepID=A0A8K0MNY9_9ROSA|nr:hypothetical protein FNV43_RR03531 [Rhamnella rubrinervis]